MDKQSGIIVLIPAYKPDARMVELVRELRDNHLDVMLVDDGGQEAFAPLFAQCRELGAEVAVHTVNLGKGRALKTGINAALLRWPDLRAIVTADADGQHTPKDILRLIDAVDEHPDTLVLGSRRFTGDVPFKSRWGNRITRAVYGLASGVRVYDTQTGLRALPRCALLEMMRIDGERYEYEMNVLLKLYWLCLFFGLSGFVSYALARLVSSQVNYHLNKHTVFSGRGGRHSMAKYYALAVVQGAIGAGLVQLLPTVLPVSAAVIKIPVDIVLFALSYIIQRDYVFGK